MRPDLSEIDAFSILIKTDWVHFDIPSDPILRYADKMRKLCNVCPLACHPHPMVEDDADSNSKHKLCTLTVIKAGFLKLDQTDYSDYERTEVAQLVKDLDKLLQVKPVEASPVEPAPKLEPVVPVTTNGKTLLEILTVCDVPVALFADGSVQAVEIGPFPFSSSGYRSLYPMPSKEDPIPPRDSVIKDLEGMVKDNAKELREAEASAAKRLKQKPSDSVGDYIYLSSDACRLINLAYFQEWPVSARLLETALKLAKKCVTIEVPDTLDHSAWNVEMLQQRLDGMRGLVDIIWRCINAKNMYELAVKAFCAEGFCSVMITNSTYADLFEAKLPDMPPSAEAYFYARLCAARYGLSEAEPVSAPVRMSGLGRLELPPADPAPESSPVAPAPPAAYPLPASKPFYVFGWMSAATISHGPQQLYVFRAGKEWGITYDLADASPFKSVDAILTYYRKIGHVHGDPEARIYDGSLMIFQHGPAGLRQIPRLTRQGSLFDNPPPFVEEQIDLLQGDDAAGLLGIDEVKIQSAGFHLVRYDRDAKTVQVTHAEGSRGWAPPVTFITYAAAERSLKETLEDSRMIQVGLEGKVEGHISVKRLSAAGFEFYRSEGIIPGHGYPRIKIGSKNWGTWCKYETGEECQAAWVELMKDPKALVG